MVLMRPLGLPQFKQVIEYVQERSTVRGLHTEALGSDQGTVELIVECSTRAELDDLVRSLEQIEGVTNVAHSDTGVASKGMGTDEKQHQGATAAE